MGFVSLSNVLNSSYRVGEKIDNIILVR